MTWGDDYNGGPDHRGKCTECGNDTYTCYDELCESCFELSEIPDDLDAVTDEEADNFTNRILILTK